MHGTSTQSHPSEPAHGRSDAPCPQRTTTTTTITITTWHASEARKMWSRATLQPAHHAGTRTVPSTQDQAKHQQGPSLFSSSLFFSLLSSFAHIFSVTVTLDPLAKEMKKKGRQARLSNAVVGFRAGVRARIARLETHGIVELRVVPERMADLTRAAGAARPCRGGDAASLTPLPPPPPSLRLRKQGGRVPLSGPRSALKVLHDGVRLRDMVPACRRLWPLEDVIDQVFPFGSPSYPTTRRRSHVAMSTLRWLANKLS
ncbi:hypothetical protein BS50DRAFT_404471 [Corynespora cassiicola Philippines]|uniref:Uncharacterized protein n=1 Tax=Corynespora cassiicola Philippines TaxID=1448308 RepID=A0A2T2NKW5_CORCC|nr:hypothetical protein BS50DRAFT_404471 [Corynespora cassiicola Philippines]